MILSTAEARNINILGGFSMPTSFSVMPTSFSVWWNEETDNSNTKTQTVGFMDSLLLFLQNENCNIVDREKVLNFLSNNVGIMDYLYRAPDTIKKQFGNVNLSLELFCEPELMSAEGELFLNILTNLDVKKAHKKMEQIDREWFIPVVAKDTDKFNINLKFT